MPKKKHTEAKEQEEKTDASEQLVEAGSASIIFSPSYHLRTIISFCNLVDLGSTISTTSKTWDKVASSMTGVWEHACQQCYGSNLRVPRWHHNPPEPRALLTTLIRSSLSQGVEESKTSCIVLELPVAVAQDIASWKLDLIQEAEEVGVKNYCRWDLIDAVQEDTAIRYSFQKLGDDMFFTAYNEAASRLGVSSCYFKTWIRGESNDMAKKGETVVIATIDGDRYQNYNKWKEQTMRSNKTFQLMPKNGYDGSIVFEVLPAIGLPGRATVDWHRA